MPLCPSISFPLDEDERHPLVEALRPWSMGVAPASLAEIYSLEPGNCFRQRYGKLWTLTLEELRVRVDAKAYGAWVAEIPAGLLAVLQRQGLDNVTTLHLLSCHPDLEVFLPNPQLLRYIGWRWRLILCEAGLIHAGRFIDAVRLNPIREIFWPQGAEEAVRYGRLIVRFLGLFPGRYPDRRQLLSPTTLTALAPLLPYFFTSRASFRFRLTTLEAFAKAITNTGMRGEDLAHLFHQALRQEKGVGIDQVMRFVWRLQANAALLGKHPVERLLRTAPSIEYLEQRLLDAQARYARKFEREAKTCQNFEAEVFPRTSLRRWPNVEQILNPLRLVVEGMYMRNCIASFEPRIQRGELAAYALSWPERCTVLLEGGAERWRVQDIRTWHDDSPEKATGDIVQRWLDGEAPPAGIAGAVLATQRMYQHVPGKSGLPDWDRAVQSLLKRKPPALQEDDDVYVRPDADSGWASLIHRIDMAAWSACIDGDAPARIGPWLCLYSLTAGERFKGAPAGTQSDLLEERWQALYFNPQCPRMIVRVSLQAERVAMASCRPFDGEATSGPWAQHLAAPGLVVPMLMREFMAWLSRPNAAIAPDYGWEQP